MLYTIYYSFEEAGKLEVMAADDFEAMRIAYMSAPLETKSFTIKRNDEFVMRVELEA